MEKGVNRVKLSETCIEQNVIVESSYGLDESDEDYLQAAEEESALDNLRDIAHQKVSLHYPIVCDTVNVCHLVQLDTSRKLSLAKLKEICAFLDIETSDILTKGRKRPFIK